MSDNDDSKKGKITLDIELQDLLSIVSKSGTEPAISGPYSHTVESEDIKKAWFEHMLLSMEKLSTLVETVRSVDMFNLRTELKQDIQKLENRFVKAEDELKVYKKDIIDPINNKVITLTVKLGIFGLMAGFVGSGIMTLILYIIREYLIKPAVMGGP